MEFEVLGPLRVVDGGVDHEIRRGIPRVLLTALAIRAPEMVNASTLMELAWDDDQPRNPANALQIQISYLRKALTAGGADGVQPIVTRPGGYALEVDVDDVDALRFEALVEATVPIELVETQLDALEGLRALDEALALWRGDALEDVRDHPFATGTAARLDEMRWGACEQRCDTLLALGRHMEAIGDLTSLVSEQPLRERFHEQLILALYRSGRQADALRAYESARMILVDELGLDPGPALQQLERDVLAQEPSLDWQPLAGPASDRTAPTAVWRQNFVPAPVTGLIGREEELQRVGELLDRSRLVTLTGPGGAGKTRLAIDLAGQAQTEGSVLYVDFSPIDLAELVGPTVAAALGTTIGPGDDPVDVVASSLATEQGLLVVDTCEHVLPGVAALVSAVLRRAPAVRVLATSRRPLAVAGETAWPVPPLGVAAPDTESFEVLAAAPAVRLFCERAQAVRPDFELNRDNAADVANICLALDGLPLAIELAAARADVLTPDATLERLHDRFDLLVEGAADAAERQQTLRGAIDWSVDLLTAEQRRFFARLGSFSGGFDLEAVEYVASEADEDALALLSALVRHSMVVPDGPGRHRLLDTVRAYAEELLAGLDADATRRRHAEFFTGLAERLERVIRGPDQAQALRRLRADIPNLRAAIEWSLAVGDLDLAARLAGSLAWFWILDGRLDVADRHLRRAATIGGVPPAIRAKVLGGYALLAAGLGNLDEALTAARSGTDQAREAGDDTAIGFGLNATAVALWALGDLDAAAVAHDEAIDRYVAAGDAWGEAVCRVLRARTALDAHDPEGEDRLRDALLAARRCGDAHVEGIALGLLAEAEGRQGRTDAAVATAAESLRLHESIGYTEGTVASLRVLARLHRGAGEPAAAHEVLLRSLRLAWKMQHLAAICESLEELARLAMDSGDPERARVLLVVAEAERLRHDLPLRSQDQPQIDELRAALEEGEGRFRLPVPELSETVSTVLR